MYYFLERLFFWEDFQLKIFSNFQIFGSFIEKKMSCSHYTWSCNNISVFDSQRWDFRHKASLNKIRESVKSFFTPSKFTASTVWVLLRFSPETRLDFVILVFHKHYVGNLHNFKLYSINKHGNSARKWLYKVQRP